LINLIVVVIDKLLRNYLLFNLNVIVIVLFSSFIVVLLLQITRDFDAKHLLVLNLVSRLGVELEGPSILESLLARRAIAGAVRFPRFGDHPLFNFVFLQRMLVDELVVGGDESARFATDSV
jgi:hypothetical protein